MMPDEKTLRVQIKEEFTERVVSCFLEILVIAGFRDDSFSGYDALRFINERFGIMFSPGRMYSTLYAMERKKLVEGSYEKGKRVYEVTELGKLTLEVVTSSDEIQAFMAKVLKK
jgi:DNA-binding PadR family transcriptional regulator